VVNSDMLKWFSEDETTLCVSCRERACVTVPDAQSSFCLHCGAVWHQGERIDVAQQRISSKLGGDRWRATIRTLRLRVRRGTRG